MLMQILTFLAWLALPFALIAIVDDWFVRPRRRAAGQMRDPPPLAFVYYALPVLLCAAVLRVLGSERLDFSLILVLAAALSGVVWGIDHWLFAPLRARALARAGGDPASVPVPVTVDYARSFFPVIVIVLLVRSFIFEPFRIPSDSMMPTLLDGDFIVVNKYAYGLRLPVLGTKILNVGSPQRGDVVVFRYPPDPAVNYIKRLVGLPGDRVQVHNDQLIINGQPQPMQNLGRYNDGCYANMQLSLESIGTHRHEMMSCRTPEGSLQAAPVASCNRGNLSNYSYLCVEDPSQPDYGDTKEIVVPAGQYFMVGDNRDNSADGRYFGFVPEANLVGKASRIWFNLDLQRSGGPMWKRIGRRIE